MEFKNLQRSLSLYQEEEPSIQVIINLMRSLVDDAEDEGGVDDVCELELGDKSAASGLAWLSRLTCDIYNENKDAFVAGKRIIDSQMAKMGDPDKVMQEYAEAEKKLSNQQETLKNLQEKQEQTAEYCKQCKQIEAECSEIQAQLAAVDPGELNSRKQELADLEQQLEEAKQKLQDLDAEKQDLIQRIQDKENEASVLQDSEIPAAKEQCAAAETRIESLKQQIGELETEKANRTAEANELETARQEREAEVKKNWDECEALKKDIQNLLDTEPEMRKKRGALLLEKEKKQEELDHYQEQNITPLEQEIAELQKKLDELKAVFEADNREKGQLAEKIGYFEAKIPSLEEEIQKQQAEFDRVNGDCTNKENLLNLLKEQIQEKKDRILALSETEIPAADAEKEENTRQEAAKRTELEISEKQIAEQKQQLEEINTQISEKQKELTNLLPQLNVAKQNFKMLSDKYDDSSNEMKKLDAVIIELEGKTDAERTSALKFQKETQIEELKQARALQDMLNQENETLHNQIEAISKEMAQIRADNEELQKQARESERIKQEMEKPYTLEQLNDMLLVSKRRLDFLKNTRESVMSVVSGMRAALENGSSIPYSEDMEVNIKTCFDCLNEKLIEYQNIISSYVASLSETLN